MIQWQSRNQYKLEWENHDQGRRRWRSWSQLCHQLMENLWENYIPLGFSASLSIKSEVFTGGWHWRPEVKRTSAFYLCVFFSNQKQGKNIKYLVSVSLHCMLFKFSCIFSSLRAMKQHCHKFSLKWKHDWGCSPGTKITYSTNRIKAVWGNINGIAPNHTNAFQLDSSILPKSSNGAPQLSAHLSSWQGYEVRKENMGILH